ncbi:MAG: precorrin-2 dehydrogenase/sirohydrochlorin ferrochelatase family protein [Acidimicrobiales bacterium]
MNPHDQSRADRAGAGRAAYPVNLVLEDQRCLVVGGGTVAARKLAGLLECGAVVDVVAPHLSQGVRDLAPPARLEEREYRRGEAAGYRLVVSATDDPAVNRTVFEDADSAGVWMNCADDPANSSFTLPAVLRRADLLVTVATSGRSPALARWLRSRLESEIGPEYEILLEMVSAEREARRAAGQATEALNWQRALDSDMLDLIRTGHLTSARDLLHTCL